MLKPHRNSSWRNCAAHTNAIPRLPISWKAASQPRLMPGLQRALAQDACQIAAAYKKSIANSCARMEGARPSEGKATHFVFMVTGLILIVAIIVGGVFAFTYRPDLARLILPVSAELTITRNSTVATKDITPYVPVMVKPIISALAPERTSTPLEPVQALDRRAPVVAKKAVITDYQTARHFNAHKSPKAQVGSLPVPSASTEAAPPVSPKSGAGPPGDVGSAAAAPLSPKPVVGISTQLLPTYPSDTNRSVDQGVTQVQVSTSAAGTIMDCHVVETSGSLRLDASACSFVQRNWQGPPPTSDNQRASGSTTVSVIWNLRAAK